MTGRLELALPGARAVYRPGEPLAGEASWRLDAAPEGLEVRLFWYTEGKGTRDVAVVATAAVPSPAAAGRHPFRFLLPPGPYSFSGRLITLRWALELVAEPAEEVARVELRVSPTGEEILLGAAPPGDEAPGDAGNGDAGG